MNTLPQSFPLAAGSPRFYLMLLQVVVTALLYAGLAEPPGSSQSLGLLSTVGIPISMLLLLLLCPRRWFPTPWWVSFVVLGNLAVLVRVLWETRSADPWIAFCALLLVGMSTYAASPLHMGMLSGLVSLTYGLMTVHIGVSVPEIWAPLALLLSFTLALINRLGTAHAELQHLTDQGERTRHASMRDALTGLPNRAQFLEHVTRSLQCSSRNRDFQFAILFIDLDGFKPVNDTLGHKAGDAVLHHVAKRLQGCLRKGDVAARFGGDEFTLLVNHVAGEGDAVRVAERVLTKLKEPMEVGKSVTVGASIGIALSSNLHERPDDVLREADGAMYRAKSLGKNQYVLSDPSRDVPKAELKDRLKRLALARW